ncbi:helix-turn-helix domain-containing protein [Nonomuraea sp. NPDC050310]|uniref:PucR family transcriptional regulator n=1 Tax=Nonomuraea sp. NPDC050310 TaxID=3154935 RepID=UPI0033E81B4C
MEDPWIARLAAGLLPEVPALAGRMLAAIVAENETYAALPAQRLAEVGEDNRLNLTEHLADLAEARPTEARAAKETARRRAEQGVPLGTVLHAYRIGFRVVWQSMVERATAEPGYPLETLATSMTSVWRLVDTYSVAVTESYQQALLDLAQREAHRRQLLLDALIEGRVSDWSVLGGSAHALGLPATGPYLCVVADPGLALATIGLRGVWRSRAEDQVGIVTACRGVRAALGGRGRIGISEPYERLPQTAAAYRVAQLVRSGLPPGSREAATVDSRPVGALVAAAPDLAERVGSAVLGRVLDRPDGEALLEVLAAWMESGQSTAELARRLYCHRNTIRNRLGRIEQLTGRSLDHPGDVAALYTALLAHRLTATG